MSSAAAHSKGTLRARKRAITAILEARYIWGDAALFRDLVSRFDAQVVKGTGQEFIVAKLAEAAGLSTDDFVARFGSNA